MLIIVFAQRNVMRNLSDWSEIYYHFYLKFAEVCNFCIPKSFSAVLKIEFIYYFLIRKRLLNFQVLQIYKTAHLYTLYYFCDCEPFDSPSTI